MSAPSHAIDPFVPPFVQLFTSPTVGKSVRILKIFTRIICENYSPTLGSGNSFASDFGAIEFRCHWSGKMEEGIISATA
jgi:hypothetical protein